MGVGFDLSLSLMILISFYAFLFFLLGSFFVLFLRKTIDPLRHGLDILLGDDRSA